MPTSGAKFGNEEEAVNVGVACHISAAAPGGPRYNRALTRAERQHISNGLWLCDIHARQIDADDKHFTEEVLHKIKSKADRNSAQAIFTLQARPIQSADLPADSVLVEVVGRFGLPATDTLSVVATRWREKATNDIACFLGTLKSPDYAIPLSLRLTDSERVTSFSAEGLAAAISAFNEIVVVAPPGTGKTTTLLQVSSAILALNQLVPVFIPLSEWSSSQDTIFASITRRASFDAEREGHLKLLAAGGRLVLVMDGWNELDSRSRKRLTGEIALLQRDFPELGIVMSTRAQAMNVPIGGPVVEIEPLSDAQQLDIARALRGPDGEGILDHAWRTPGIRELVTIPLYLTTLLAHAPGERLPTTKEEVLRIFVLQHERPGIKADELEAATLGLHNDMLGALAVEATITGNNTIAERRARAVLTAENNRLIDDCQLSAGKEPLPVALLAILVSHHLLVRNGVAPAGYAFQHQQFQEWFASFWVEKLMSAPLAGDKKALQRLRIEVLDQPSWEEAILFACERASRTSPGGAAAVGCLIRESLTIDPMLAAEAIFRSSDAVWSEVQDHVVKFVEDWHTKGKVDRAVRFMITTGRSEFADAIWPLVSSTDEQLSLKALRSGRRFRASVLGSQVRTKIAALPPKERRRVLSELTHNSSIEGLDLAADLAVEEKDPEIQVAVIEGLVFRQANRHIDKVLAAAVEDVWPQLADRGFGSEITTPGASERLRTAAARNRDAKASPSQKLWSLLQAARHGAVVGPQIEALVEAEEFGDKDDRGDTMFEANNLYPKELQAGLVKRLAKGSGIPYYAERLLQNTGLLIDEGPIVGLVFSPVAEKKLARVAAQIVGPETAGKMIDA